jgi:hypothetical protein
MVGFTSMQLIKCMDSFLFGGPTRPRVVTPVVPVSGGIGLWRVGVLERWSVGVLECCRLAVFGMVAAELSCLCGGAPPPLMPRFRV